MLGPSIGEENYAKMGTQSLWPNSHPKFPQIHFHRCPSKIRYGLGPVPDSYYVNQATAMQDYDQLTVKFQIETKTIIINFKTVYAGDKHLIELKVKANTRIR